MSDQKCAYITGGSRGIGAGIAMVLAQKGYDICFTYSSAADEANQRRAEIEALGRRCFVIEAQLNEPDQAVRKVKEAIRLLGHIDLHVNNAGLTICEHTLEMTPEKIDYLINLNFRSYILGASTAAKHMVKHGIKGNIIHITSTRSLRAYATDAIYGGLKSAINRATESMALDLAPYGIRVNCVLPGATRIRDLDQPYSARQGTLAANIPLGRLGTPTDIGHAVAFLASDDASYITGATLKVDGGLILPGMPEGENPGWNAFPRTIEIDDPEL